MFIEPVRIASLSNTTYVVGSELSGWCAVIDPVRDIDHYTSIAANHGVRINYALETHVHNDFVSGARGSWPPRPAGGRQRLGGPAISLPAASGG